MLWMRLVVEMPLSRSHRRRGGQRKDAEVEDNYEQGMLLLYSRVYLNSQAGGENKRLPRGKVASQSDKRPHAAAWVRSRCRGIG
jgi:hypothetical protein